MKEVHGKRLFAASSLLGALLVVAVVLSPSAGAKGGQEKMEICHVTDDPEQGDGVVITIAKPAWKAHAAHGDMETVDELVTVDGDGMCHVSTAPAAPVARDDQVTTPAGTKVTIDVLANDSYDSLASASIQSWPQNGSMSQLGLGIWEYTPIPIHPGTDSFSYKLCDTAGQCDTATVTITVGP